LRALGSVCYYGDFMDRSDEVLEVLKRLKKKHGRVLSLNTIFRELLKERIYESKRAIADCLRKLQAAKKIRPVKFGVNIEILEDSPVEYIQSSLAVLKKKI